MQCLSEERPIFPASCLLCQLIQPSPSLFLLIQKCWLELVANPVCPSAPVISTLIFYVPRCAKLSFSRHCSIHLREKVLRLLFHNGLSVWVLEFTSVRAFSLQLLGRKQFLLCVSAALPSEVVGVLSLPHKSSLVALGATHQHFVTANLLLS